ncbi:LysR substrate-binding domain-containing protein [Roseovarius sp. 2305UL8-3]|uniref:LysR substrate-binding domain-containing protein n=1 Tax=Roseovarius conchicola TaxID=3121636 RepID=UPI00352870E4
MAILTKAFPLYAALPHDRTGFHSIRRVMVHNDFDKRDLSGLWIANSLFIRRNEVPRNARRLPLTALRTFEAAARHLSFKDAAAELCVSATTVSNQIRQLEKDWGCKLFNRHTRAVSLTERGSSLAGVLTSAFDQIQAEVENHIVVPRKTVSIAVGPIFGSRWLGQRLTQFSKEHPKIDLVVHHGSRITDSNQMQSDLAVDWGVGEWRGLEATRLVEARYSPIISPDLARETGPLTDPRQLAGLTIIHQHDRSEWENWFALADCPDLKLESEVTIVDSNMVQRAVKDGQGVALGVFPFMDRDVAQGQLIKPFDIDLLPTRAFHLLEQHEARRSSAIRTVCEWIEAEADSDSSL